MELFSPAAAGEGGGAGARAGEGGSPENEEEGISLQEHVKTSHPSHRAGCCLGGCKDKNSLGKKKKKNLEILKFQFPKKKTAPGVCQALPGSAAGTSKFQQILWFLQENLEFGGEKLCPDSFEIKKN